MTSFVLDRAAEFEMAASDTVSTSQIVVVGVGGATCSGKTTLAKHLVQILNSSEKSSSDKGGITDAFILHQDDFAPLESTLPVNEELGVTDWDHPPTAVSSTVSTQIYKTIIETAH